jgi:methyl-accepting chemotaxis protein
MEGYTVINKNTMRTERSVVRGSGSTTPEINNITHITHIINNITHIINNITHITPEINNTAPEINNSVTGINNTVSQINNSMNTMTGINTLSMGRTCKRVSGERETKELIMEVLI